MRRSLDALATTIVLTMPNDGSGVMSMLPIPAVGMLALVLTATVVLTSQISSAQKASGDKPAAAVEGPETLYKQHCQSCHLDGNSPIVELNFANGNWKYGSRLSDVVKVVRDGIPGTAMLSFAEKLSEKEIRALAEHVRRFDKSLKRENPKKFVKPRG